MRGNFVDDYFVVQAFLAVNPNVPHWADVAAWALAGHKEVAEAYPPHKTIEGWAPQVFLWRDLETAQRGFGMLQDFPQKQPLRLVHRIIQNTEVVIPIRPKRRAA